MRNNIQSVANFVVATIQSVQLRAIRNSGYIVDKIVLAMQKLQIFAVFMIMCMYLGNLIVCFMIVDGNKLRIST